MSFNTDWDVEQYKTEHESEEHWALRRSFMLAHKDKFPEERLVCLAQVFFNVEFLGCRYPLETMKLVAELSKGVADKFRQQKEGKLKRTFVQASDAAGAKAKGLKRPAQENASTNNPFPSSSDTRSPTPNKKSPVFAARGAKKQNAKLPKSGTTILCPLQTSFVPQSCQGTKMAQITFGPAVHPSGKSSDHHNNSTNGSTSKFDRSRYGGVQTYHIDQTKPSKPLVEPSKPIVEPSEPLVEPSKSIVEPSKPIVEPSKPIVEPNKPIVEPITYGPFGKIIIIEQTNPELSAMDTLNRSAALSKVKIQTTYETDKSGFVTCTIHINDKLLSTGRDKMRRNAIKAAAVVGVKLLKETCYTIKVKHNFLSDTTIDKTLDVLPSKSDTNTSYTEAPVLDNSVGSRLLRLMGWSGGGLGKDEQGIKEPVQIEEHVNRAGLGLRSGVTNVQQFKQKMFRIMKDYAASNSSYDLVFSPEFSIEERKVMHEVATKLKLKTKSYGKTGERHMVVSKPKDMWVTLEQLLQNGGSTEKYELVKPSGPRS